MSLVCLLFSIWKSSYLWRLMPCDCCTWTAMTHQHCTHRLQFSTCYGCGARRSWSKLLMTGTVSVTTDRSVDGCAMPVCRALAAGRCCVVKSSIYQLVESRGGSSWYEPHGLHLLYPHRPWGPPSHGLSDGRPLVRGLVEMGSADGTEL